MKEGKLEIKFKASKKKKNTNLRRKRRRFIDKWFSHMAAIHSNAFPINIKYWPRQPVKKRNSTFLSLSLFLVSEASPPKNESLKGTRKSRILECKYRSTFDYFPSMEIGLPESVFVELHLSIAIIKHRDFHASRELCEICFLLRYYLRRKNYDCKIFSGRNLEFS